MGKIYYLDLKTLLETLAGQSCMLQREIPKNVTRLSENYLCSLSLSPQGSIISCVLTDKSGRRFDGFQLLPSLYTLENWEVTIVLEPNQLSPSLQTIPQYSPILQSSPSSSNQTNDEEIIPYLLTQNAMGLLLSWSHKERLLASTILLQIDGMRSIADIRAQLSFSQSSIEQTFTLLYQRGVIGFRRSTM